MGLTVRRYDDTLRGQWDAFVHASKNGTFLFLRDYMDYHRDRFVDHSLLVLNQDRPIAVLPANILDDEMHSHQGLTYGGFVSSPAMTTPLMIDVFASVAEYLRAEGIRRLFYKTVPSIYHRCPAEEDRYALFLADAVLYRRDVLSVVPMHRVCDVQARRRRSAAKASTIGMRVATSDDWQGYWWLLSDTLEDRFGAVPVHSIYEIERLKKRFPENISLHLALLGNEIQGGVVIYETAMVAHAQYIAASTAGRNSGALDTLFFHLLEQTFVKKPFFDFGISNEQQGRILNRGLIQQKEGFGARAIAHDFYRLEL